MPIVVFVNPGSRANRRDPGRAGRFSSILGETGYVVSPTSSEELAAQARKVAEAHPSIIGVHGGDGTLHWTVTALLRAYGQRPLPPLALLVGGTMNVVASSLGIQVQPETLLAQLAAGERAGLQPKVIARCCLKIVLGTPKGFPNPPATVRGEQSSPTPHAGIQEEFGFVFGTGLISNFLEEYYAKGAYGAGRAISILIRSVLSEATTGGYSQRIFRRFQG
ncbi:MAG TPA: acylglycerol kinase family protein, partial [Polyangia bacterium]